ncbi:hypothetical protein C9168_24945 (plasmid) [Escherichia coli]|nr:hypothetical protein C9168_24945 [Escherichia coli]TJH13207.1 hypothetical protein C9159_25320 [Escherichia coli]TJI41524.1 hypothetical protein C9134_24940 [Escherichia coli]TJI50610.1 hypothetical protein C9133_24910 [Escherichia coli]TJI56210.1 hypothetical protein C9130_24910 [Escherichia coli]
MLTARYSPPSSVYKYVVSASDVFRPRWTCTYTCSPLISHIPVAAGHPEHMVHCFDAEIRLMFFNKDILHFRRFAK